jgi:hypothetical protein
MKLLFVFFSFIAVSIYAYPRQARFSQLKPNVDCKSNPPILSYHIHVTYMLTNDQQIKDVSAFRDRAAEYFWGKSQGKEHICQGTAIEPSGRYGNMRNFSLICCKC